jgi:hypothetical protein
VAISKPLPSSIITLIDRILTSGGDDPARLELTIDIRHENVMGLQYQRGGRFRWSKELYMRERSDHEQVEFIEEFGRARSKHAEAKNTIGHFICFSQPLQAAVVPRSSLDGLPVLGWLADRDRLRDAVMRIWSLKLHLRGFRST